jgi:phosphoglycolate phosphatase
VTKPGLEIVNDDRPRGLFRAMVFDFDDTLSLLRSGWQSVMLHQALDELAPLRENESRDELASYISTYIDDLTGQPTIHQMERLAEEVAWRGGKPQSAESYKEAYANRLATVKNERIAAIQTANSANAMIVAGAESLLNSLAAKQIPLILCSGTDDDAVQREMGLLGLAKYFTPHIYGAPANDPTFSKGRVLDDMIRQLGIKGGEIVGFGDGVVEIRETRRVGGYAIGVAKWSADRPEEFARHRLRLIEAGAQAIIPDYEAHSDILKLLGLS